MEITNARYVDQEGYPFLEATLDGKTFRISAEQKPTLARHGIVSIPGSSYSATLPDGRVVDHAAQEPNLFRLFVAFALDMRHGREFRGGELSIAEFYQISQELEGAGLPGAKPMVEYLPVLDG